MESWRDIIGFENYYEISDLGNARSKERLYYNKTGRLITKHSKVLKPIVGINGYIRFGLKVPEDTKVYKVLAHRAVALAWIPNDEQLQDVGHMNDVRDDNCVTNLYWTSKKDNIIKAVESGSVNDYAVVKSNSKHISAYKDSEKLDFNSMTEAATFFECSVGNISNAVKNNHTCCGYNVVLDAETCTKKEELTCDKYENAAIMAKPVAIEDADGNIVIANSVQSAARKVGRSASSVKSAIDNNRKCNGFRVYLCAKFND